MERENAETAGYEYYYKKDGETYIVEKPTLIEAVLAKATKTSKRKVVGYRKESIKFKNSDELKKHLVEKSKQDELSVKLI